LQYVVARGIFVAIVLVLFAFDTIPSWNFYSRQDLLNIVQQAVKSGDSFEKLYPVVSCWWDSPLDIAFDYRHSAELEMLWKISGLFNGLGEDTRFNMHMALAGELRKLTKEQEWPLTE
jgi:Na+/alanine symporter